MGKHFNLAEAAALEVSKLQENIGIRCPLPSAELVHKCPGHGRQLVVLYISALLPFASSVFKTHLPRQEQTEHSWLKGVWLLNQVWLQHNC